MTSSCRYPSAARTASRSSIAVRVPYWVTSPSCGFDPPVPRWSTNRKSGCELSAGHARIRPTSLGGGVPRPAGEIRNRVLGDRLRPGGHNDHLEADRGPVRLRAVLGDDKGAAAGADPLHQARLRRPRPRPRLRLARKERFVDADASAGGGHHAGDKPHDPSMRPVNSIVQRVRPRRHGRTSIVDHSSTRAMRHRGAHGSCIRAFAK